MSHGTSMAIERIGTDDRNTVEGLLKQAWGSTKFATCGSVVDARDLPGFLASRDGAPVGLLTYAVTGKQCELLTLNAFQPFQGIGTALISAFLSEIASNDLDRIFLITTNDNVDAIRFYQKRGWRLSAVRPGAVDEARATIKPQIPLIGHYDIPIRDELEFEWKG